MWQLCVYVFQTITDILWMKALTALGILNSLGRGYLAYTFPLQNDLIYLQFPFQRKETDYVMVSYDGSSTPLTSLPTNVKNQLIIKRFVGSASTQMHHFARELHTNIILLDILKNTKLHAYTRLHMNGYAFVQHCTKKEERYLVYRRLVPLRRTFRPNFDGVNQLSNLMHNRRWSHTDVMADPFTNDAVLIDFEDMTKVLLACRKDDITQLTQSHRVLTTCSQ